MLSYILQVFYGSLGLWTFALFFVDTHHFLYGIYLVLYFDGLNLSISTFVFVGT